MAPACTHASPSARTIEPGIVSKGGYPYEQDQYLVSGASWAVMALARPRWGPCWTSLSRDGIPDAPVWSRGPKIVSFGSVDELRGLLDFRFRPQQATLEGTTALMMAIPHLEKAKLLLGSGGAK